MLRETILKGRPRLVPRVSLSIYLNLRTVVRWWHSRMFLVGYSLDPACARAERDMPVYWTNFATAAAGPALACIITNPADVAKTRLNLERELQSTEMSSTVLTRAPSRPCHTYAAVPYVRSRAVRT